MSLIKKKIRQFIRWFLFILIVIQTSCIPQRKLEYLQNIKEDSSSYELKDYQEYRIKPHDELLISVSSFDDVNFNYFESQNQTGSYYYSSELSLSASAFIVNDTGYIYFPIINYLKVEGLTLEEAIQKLQVSLNPYFDQPNVTVKFAYKKITILGEVNYPGYHTYAKNRINIFEALGIARDLTIHADRKNIFIIRTKNNRTYTQRINLRKDDIFSSHYYYLQSDDIIYVKPRSSTQWHDISTPISLILTSITTTILVLNFIQ